jgi:prolyl-tRNA editing enzyme YbaK/EbsC (Cys-tRNA(Pro) deacylase)
MTDKPVDLDKRRGMAAQKATSLRRLLSDVEANEKSQRARQEELETQLVAAPAETWADAAEKARYLLGLYAATLSAQDTRKRELLAAVFADFKRLSRG